MLQVYLKTNKIQIFIKNIFFIIISNNYLYFCAGLAIISKNSER